MASIFVVEGAVASHEGQIVTTDRREKSQTLPEDHLDAAVDIPPQPQQQGQPASMEQSSTTYTEVQEPLGGKQPAVTATAPSLLSSTELSGINKSQHAFPFSEDLMRILKEVAVKGSSSVLPWKHDDTVWKRPQSRTNAKEGGMHTVTAAAATTRSSASTGSQPDTTRRHHDFYAQARHGRGSHKRTRISTMPSRHLHASHRSHYAGGGSTGNPNRNTTTAAAAASSSSSSSSSSTTMTTTMVVEPKNVVASIHKTFPNGTVQQSTGATSSLFVLRPQSSSSSQLNSTSMLYQNSLFLPNSSSGRTTSSINSYTAASGSEHEDTSQYECDSEGTSATSNSEMSFNSSISKRRGMQTMGNIVPRVNVSLTTAKRIDPVPRPQYLSVRDALVSALTLVLDYYYHNHGGYKLSPLEKRIYDAAAENNNVLKNDTAKAEGTDAIRNSEEIFQKRKKRLLEMLGKYCMAADFSDHESSDMDKGPNIILNGINNIKGSPPFTIQRLAEVLMEPERYYSQTHKLCNCLEKLLLVTSSADAFGGSIGGGTTQSRQEETEIAALSEERKRLRSEFRQRHKKSRRASNTTGTSATEQSTKSVSDVDESNKSRPGDAARTGIPDADADDDDDELLPVPPHSTSDPLDAAARATLRSKFDHVGIDPHSQAAMANSRDVMALMETRRLTNTSPPPPSLSHSALQQQQQLHPRQSSPLRSSPSPSSSPESSKAMLSPRIPSPLLFHHINNHGYDGSPTLSPLLTSTLSNSVNVPLPHQPQHHSHLSSPSSAMLSTYSHSIGATLYHADSSGSIETQKSSPASSDLDSESDVDDSASDDRSDGSDNEKPSYEPLNAAQAMALNRRHQQARMQSRLLSAAATQQQQQQNSNTNNTHTQSSGIMDGYHHRSNNNESPATGTGSSGDSLDSTRAEDSGGSDSSSSDHAD